MFSAPVTGLCLAVLSWLVAAPAWAQDAVCPNGESCVESYRWGAWGLIALGLLFFAIFFIPAARRDEGGTSGVGLSLISFLQVRIEKETTGWRRWQWPVLGVFFVGLGISFLTGWR